MAARLSPKHDEATRMKIKTSQLVNRLNKFALGESDGKTGNPVEMSTQQVKAADILLRKMLPDLKSTELSGSLGLTKDPASMTDEELAAIASTGSATPSKP